jgi:hypothetical protein
MKNDRQTKNAASEGTVDALVSDDSQFRCTVCGRIGTVGRCCGLETREPLNELARLELERESRRIANAPRQPRRDSGVGLDAVVGNSE